MEIELLYCTHAAPSPAVVQSTGVTVGAKVVAWLRRRAKSDEVSRASARCSVVLGVVVVDADKFETRSLLSSRPSIKCGPR